MSSNSIALEAEALTAKDSLRGGAISIARKLWNDILLSRPACARDASLFS